MPVKGRVRPLPDFFVRFFKAKKHAFLGLRPREACHPEQSWRQVLRLIHPLIQIRIKYNDSRHNRFLRQKCRNRDNWGDICRRRGILCHLQHQSRCNPRPLRYAGHHLDRMDGPLARPGRGPGNLPDCNLASGGSESYRCAWIFDVRYVFCLCHFPGWHRYVLGPQPRAGIYEPVSREASPGSLSHNWPRCHLNRMGIPVCLD